MDMIPRAPSNLPSLVKTAFARARATGDLNYYPTQVALLRHESTTFQLRFSPTLANKPSAPTSSSSSSKALPNPFESPPPALTIADFPPHHVLVLNKFAIVPEHFLLITTTFKAQTDLLEPEDIAATYACIEAYNEVNGQELFAFFNSGEHSGASQPHRHVQLLPVVGMKEGLDEGSDWEVLADHLVQTNQATSRKVPFAVYGELLPRHEDGTTNSALLHQAYLRLYRKACARVLGEDDVASTASQYSGPARISYNMAMTRKSLILCPRRADSQAVQVQDDNGSMTEVGHLSLNGTFLGGTALVKSKEEFAALKDDTSQQLWSILGGIGYESDAKTDKVVAT